MRPLDSRIVTHARRAISFAAAAGARSPARSARALPPSDRKSTRLNSSHQIISYAVFCLKKKKNHDKRHQYEQKHTQEHIPHRPLTDPNTCDLPHVQTSEHREHSIATIVSASPLSLRRQT